MDSKKGAVSSTKMKSKQNGKEEKLADMAAKIEETDEMKLKMLAALDQPQPDDVLYPAELNAHLIEQLKVMTCENNELRKSLFTKEAEKTELAKTVTELNQRIRDIITGTGPAISSKSAGVIGAKITDLCKQNRHLVSEVEGYKTKNAALERKIMQLDLINKEHEKLDICLCKDVDPTDATSDELKELNSKLITVNKKLYDSKNRNYELKNEILVATKILQQELGDKFTSLKELQNDMAGWKGRAERIVLLQAKINELEEKLNIKKDERQYVDKSKDHLQIIKDIQMKKKKETEEAVRLHEIAKEEIERLKTKLDGSKCRIRNLECNAITIRNKMQTLFEKSTHDDMLINEQRAQIKNLELYYQDILKENTAKMNKMNSEISEYHKLNKNTDAKIDALRKQATEKAAKIEELRAQLLRYEECSLQSVFFTPMKTATDNEIKQLSDLVVTLNDRLDGERRKWDELDCSHRKLKEKKRRLERRVTLLEEEARALIKEESRRGSRVSKSSLPKDNQYEFGAVQPSVSKLGKKRSSAVGVTAERQSETTSSESQQEHYETLDKDELKYRLELTDEKLKIMEDKLKMIEEEKAEDYSHLTEMIQTSKQLFNEALAVLQKEKCLCS